MSNWIYLSPHFDDAVFSCGGMIWEQVRAGHHVEIWTICAGDPPPGPLPPFAADLHLRWKSGREAVAIRRSEDEAACAAVGAGRRLFSLPDVVYRCLPGTSQPVIRQNDDLWLPLQPAEQPIVDQVSAWLAENLPKRVRLVCPMTIGGHHDHRLVRAAAEQLDRKVWYYPDYPYSVREDVNMRDWLLPGWRRLNTRVTDQGVLAWQAGVEAYATQISTFWADLIHMREAIRAYRDAGGGSRLWG